jgi:hypothetical protein
MSATLSQPAAKNKPNAQKEMPRLIERINTSQQVGVSKQNAIETRYQHGVAVLIVGKFPTAACQFV